MSYVYQLNCFGSTFALVSSIVLAACASQLNGLDSLHRYNCFLNNAISVLIFPNCEGSHSVRLFMHDVT
jgi:hypothetical protein